MEKVPKQQTKFKRNTGGRDSTSLSPHKRSKRAPERERDRDRGNSRRQQKTIGQFKGQLKKEGRRRGKLERGNKIEIGDRE